MCDVTLCSSLCLRHVIGSCADQSWAILNCGKKSLAAALTTAAAPPQWLPLKNESHSIRFAVNTALMFFIFFCVLTAVVMCSVAQQCRVGTKLWCLTPYSVSCNFILIRHTCNKSLPQLKLAISFCHVGFTSGWVRFHYCLFTGGAQVSEAILPLASLIGVTNVSCLTLS